MSGKNADVTLSSGENIGNDPFPGTQRHNNSSNNKEPLRRSLLLGRNPVENPQGFNNRPAVTDDKMEQLPHDDRSAITGLKTSTPDDTAILTCPAPKKPRLIAKPVPAQTETRFFPGTTTEVPKLSKDNFLSVLSSFAPRCIHKCHWDHNITLGEYLQKHFYTVLPLFQIDFQDLKDEVQRTFVNANPTKCFRQIREYVLANIIRLLIVGPYTPLPKSKNKSGACLHHYTHEPKTSEFVTQLIFFFLTYLNPHQDILFKDGEEVRNYNFVQKNKHFTDKLVRNGTWSIAWVKTLTQGEYNCDDTSHVNGILYGTLEYLSLYHPGDLIQKSSEHSKKRWVTHTEIKALNSIISLRRSIAQST